MVSNLFSGFVQIATFHSEYFSKECVSLSFVDYELKATVYNASEHPDVIKWSTNQEYTLYNTKTNTLFVSKCFKLMLIQLWRFLNAAISLL